VVRAVGKAGTRTLGFIHILCRIVSDRGGRDAFPTRPREGWVNGMPLQAKYSQFIRPDASVKRPYHGMLHDVYKDQTRTGGQGKGPACGRC